MHTCIFKAQTTCTCIYHTFSGSPIISLSPSNMSRPTSYTICLLPLQTLWHCPHRKPDPTGDCSETTVQYLVSGYTRKLTQPPGKTVPILPHGLCYPQQLNHTRTRVMQTIFSELQSTQCSLFTESSKKWSTVFWPHTGNSFLLKKKKWSNSCLALLHIFFTQRY